MPVVAPPFSGDAQISTICDHEAAGISSQATERLPNPPTPHTLQLQALDDAGLFDAWGARAGETRTSDKPCGLSVR